MFAYFKHRHGLPVSPHCQQPLARRRNCRAVMIAPEPRTTRPKKSRKMTRLVDILYINICIYIFIYISYTYHILPWLITMICHELYLLMLNSSNGTLHNVISQYSSQDTEFAQNVSISDTKRKSVVHLYKGLHLGIYYDIVISIFLL